MKREIVVTPLQEKLLEDLMKGVQQNVIAWEQKKSQASISQMKKRIIKNNPALERIFKRQSRKYRRIMVEIPN